MSQWALRAQENREAELQECGFGSQWVSIHINGGSIIKPSYIFFSREVEGSSF